MRISDWSSDVCSSDLLFLRHPADDEVLALRVAEVVPGNRRGRQHREAVREFHAGVSLGVEQCEQHALFAVLGAGGLTGGGADPPVFLGNPGRAFERLGASEGSGMGSEWGSRCKHWWC